jgi:hypothetical protein
MAPLCTQLAAACGKFSFLLLRHTDWHVDDLIGNDILHVVVVSVLYLALL